MAVDHLSWMRVFTEKQDADGKKKVVSFQASPNLVSPPYGWAPKNSPTRTEEFIKKCADKVPLNSNYSAFGEYSVRFKKASDFMNQINIDKIKSAMSCASCHNNTERGYLHGSFSHGEIMFKVAIDRRMPPPSGDFDESGFDKSELNESERYALANCLLAEREDPTVASEWRKSGQWMKTKPCQEERTKGKPDSSLEVAPKTQMDQSPNTR